MEFCYWLSTNSLTWRGTDAAARALAAIGHPEAAGLVEESKAFGSDLRRGFDTARRASPLVRLANGRWVPSFPSRLYRRGREYGWIRELLEGSVYLLISGLYDVGSREASWILDDYQDNRYLAPPYGYALRDVEGLYFQRGGFSIQPCLLAGLAPHLARDEPEVAIWMYFNSIAACYREDIEGLSEHPLPELGFSNSAHWKTSDEANTVMWLRPHEGARPRLLARFRHPESAPLARVLVNDNPWARFDAGSEDVDLTGLEGDIRVHAFFDRGGT